tara:strand:- start:683 stop:931 length:249 start_codon:yes stop_codon:yes gene_type:complete
MKYFYFISIILLISVFFIFTGLNPNLIEIDLFFLKIEGISIGFSIIISILLGAIISFILQFPKLFGRKSKVRTDKKSENTSS